jgi:hypothetical protein
LNRLTQIGHSDISPATKPAIRDEFRVQLICLQCVREAVYVHRGACYNTCNSTDDNGWRYTNNHTTTNMQCSDAGPSAGQRVSSLGGWERLIDVIFWTTEVFSVNPVLMRSKFFDTEPEQAQSNTNASYLAPPTRDYAGFVPDDALGYMTCQLIERPAAPLPAAEQFIRAPTREVMAILHTLMSLCKAQAINSSSDGGDSPSLSSSSGSPPQFTASSSFSLPSSPVLEDPSSGLSKVNRVIVNVLLDLFNVDIRQTANNTRVRNKIKYVDQVRRVLLLFDQCFQSVLLSHAYPNSHTDMNILSLSLSLSLCVCVCVVL